MSDLSLRGRGQFFFYLADQAPDAVCLDDRLMLRREMLSEHAEAEGVQCAHIEAVRRHV